MDCWYQQGCNLFTEGCQKTCHRYLQMSYLIENCGMPDANKYIKPLVPEKQDVPAFMRLKQIKDNIVDFVEQGCNIYITSKKLGNGKTTWSLKLLYKYFDEVWCGNGFVPRGYFVYVPEFLNRYSYNYKSSDEFKDLAKLLKSVDLVVWDDIAYSKLTQTECTVLNTFVDYRLMKGKSNIFTGCLLGREIATNLDERLYTRLWEDIEVVEFIGKGNR